VSTAIRLSKSPRKHTNTCSSFLTRGAAPDRAVVVDVVECEETIIVGERSTGQAADRTAAKQRCYHCGFETYTLGAKQRWQLDFAKCSDSSRKPLRSARSAPIGNLGQLGRRCRLTELLIILDAILCFCHYSWHDPTDTALTPAPRWPSGAVWSQLLDW